MGRGITPQDLAAEIDRLLTARDNLPTVGGEYDTKIGWQRRLGIPDHKQLAKAIDMLMQCGKAKIVRGLDRRNNAPYICDLVWSAELAKRAKKSRPAR